MCSIQIVQTSFGIIRTTMVDSECVFVAKDVQNALGLKNMNHKREGVFPENEKRMINVSTTKGIRDTIALTEKGLKRALRSCRNQRAAQLAEELGINLETIRVEYKEESTVMFIVYCFLNKFKMTRQYRVGDYRVDLYVHDLNLVIECDENDHKNYNPEKDHARTDTINRLLANPTWIRYNPDKPIHEVVNQIVQLM